MASDQDGARPSGTTPPRGTTPPSGTTPPRGTTPPSGTTPPRGWQLPGDEEQGADADSLAQLIEELLALVPDDLRLRLTAAVRQLLEAIRALIDWCAARLEHRESDAVEVHDIPIL